MSTHYDTLGIPPEASADDVKRAYRKRARKAHPDTGGGHEAMAAVNKAYEVLADPRRRLEYDTMGSDGEKSVERKAHELLSSMFAHALSKDAPNLLVTVRGMLSMQQAEARAGRVEATAKRAKFLKRRDRIRVKHGQNIVHALIDEVVLRLDGQIATAEEEILVGTAASALADAYESDEEVEIVTARYPMGTGMFTFFNGSGGQR